MPFDFLIQNEFLRSSLGAFLLRKNISAEAEVKVEYLPILPEPEPTQAHQQPDWISALATVSRAPCVAAPAATAAAGPRESRVLLISTRSRARFPQRFCLRLL